MASAAEQLASHISLAHFSKATELKKRIWFTLGALMIYRLGTYIPLPGIDPTILADVFKNQQSGILGMFDMFAGGAFGPGRGSHSAATRTGLATGSVFTSAILMRALMVPLRPSS